MKRLAAALLAALAAQAQAADWPQGPVRLLVGSGPGSEAAVLARIVAPALGAALGQPLAIEHRPGSSGTLAAAQVARAAPDGHTALLLEDGDAASAASPRGLPYDLLADFQPVSMVATMPLVVLAGPRAGFGSLQGLIEVAQHNPGKLSYASTGPAGAAQLAAELLFQRAGIHLQQLRFKNAAYAIGATGSNVTQVLVETAAVALGQVRARALNALAVTSAERFAGLPGVPTVAEAALPGYDVSSWYALAFPAGTPAPVVERMRGALRAALEREAVRAQLAQAAFLPAESTPEELAAHLRSEIARWGAVRGKAGMR
jgi:tripartite-type tricarboxylate transporter receptor subunit TctC